MAILTQGTEIYILVNNENIPGEKRIVKVECPTAFQPGEDSADQIDTTCLDADARSFMDGLRTPGQGSLTINADPRSSSHLLLSELAAGRTSDGKDPFPWAVGWSDGKGIKPVLNANKDGWELPDTRTWIEFLASVSTFPFDFSGNAVVATNCTISRSGDSRWLPKAGGGAAILPTEYTITVTDPIGFVLRVGTATTATIAHDADETAVESALDALGMADSVTVTGAAPDFTATFTEPQGELSGFGADVTAI